MTDSQFTKPFQDQFVSIDWPAIGETIREIRKEAGYSMRELSKKIGCAVNEIEQIERGLLRPTLEVLFYLKHLLMANPCETISQKKTYDR